MIMALEIKKGKKKTFLFSIAIGQIDISLYMNLSSVYGVYLIIIIHM